MARKLVNTKEISHDAWLALREKSLGGSEIGSILGMNQYSSPLQVYCIKKGLVKPKETTEAMRLGTDLEGYVAQRYTELTGKKVRNDNWMYQDDEFDFMTANIDRRILGENAGLECKVMGFSASGFNFDIGEVPPQYYAQCQWYQMIMGFDRMDLAVLILQQGIKVVEIRRDDDFIKQMREAAVDFWNTYIIPGQMPVPDGEADLDTLKELYPEAEADTEIEIFNLDQMIEDYTAAGEMAKHYKDIQDGVKGQICAKLGDYETGIGDTYGCTWKNQSKESFDTKRFKKEHPDLYKQYVNTSNYRVFRTKTVKR